MISNPWQSPGCANVALLRSSLFGMARRDQRITTHTVASLTAQHIGYRGAYLSQYDGDIVLALHYLTTLLTVHTYSIQLPTDLTCRISLSQLFAVLNNRHYGRTDYQLVQTVVNRLANVECCIYYGKQHFHGQFFTTLCLERAGKQIVFVFNPEYVQFINTTAAVVLNLSQRMALPRGLARWLHGFWSTYKTIPVTELDSLQLYCGTNEKRRGNFKKRLLIVLKQLTQVGFIDNNWRVSQHGVVSAQHAKLEKLKYI